VNKINSQLRLLYYHILDDGWDINDYNTYFGAFDGFSAFDGLYIRLHHAQYFYTNHIFVSINS
jgi:hypothetical protein